MTTLILDRNFQLMARCPQIVERIIHVGLIGRLGILDKNPAGSHDADRERNKEVSKIEFHPGKMTTFGFESMAATSFLCDNLV